MRSSGTLLTAWLQKVQTIRQPLVWTRRSNAPPRHSFRPTRRPATGNPPVSRPRLEPSGFSAGPGAVELWHGTAGEGGGVWSGPRGERRGGKPRLFFFGGGGGGCGAPPPRPGALFGAAAALAPPPREPA